MGAEDINKGKLHRISVNNFAAEFFSRSNKAKLFAILNERWMDIGKTKAGPIGGGALLTDRGYEYLQDNDITLIEKESFEPRDSSEKIYTVFEEDGPMGLNARFIVPADKFDAIHQEFSDISNGFYEQSPRRELQEELTAPPKGKQRHPAMTSYDFVKGYKGDQYVGSIQHTDSSSRKPGAVSYYNWHLHQIEVSDIFFNKLREATKGNYFFEVDREALKRTEKGILYIKPFFPALESLKKILDKNTEREAKNGHQRKHRV